MRDLFAAMFFFFFALRIDLGDIPPVLAPAIALIAISCVPELAALAATLVLGTALLGPLATHFADDLARLLPQGGAATVVQRR